MKNLRTVEQQKNFGNIMSETNGSQEDEVYLFSSADNRGWPAPGTHD
jgi:hypothetical protein